MLQDLKEEADRAISEGLSLEAEHSVFAGPNARREVCRLIRMRAQRTEFLALLTAGHRKAEAPTSLPASRQCCSRRSQRLLRPPPRSVVSHSDGALISLLMTDSASLCGTVFDEGKFRQRELDALSHQFEALAILDERLSKSSEVLRASAAPLDSGLAYDNTVVASRVCEVIEGMTGQTRDTLEQVERQAEARRLSREARHVKEEAWRAEVSSDVERVRTKFEEEQVTDRRNKAVAAEAKVDLALSGLDSDAFAQASSAF